jgi:hypothetical protein
MAIKGMPLVNRGRLSKCSSETLILTAAADRLCGCDRRSTGQRGSVQDGLAPR